jgi:hypothetical protein
LRFQRRNRPWAVEQVEDAGEAVDQGVGEVLLLEEAVLDAPSLGDLQPQHIVHPGELGGARADSVVELRVPAAEIVLAAVRVCEGDEHHELRAELDEGEKQVGIARQALFDELEADAARGEQAPERHRALGEALEVLLHEAAHQIVVGPVETCGVGDGEPLQHDLEQGRVDLVERFAGEARDRELLGDGRDHAPRPFLCQGGGLGPQQGGEPLEGDAILGGQGVPREVDGAVPQRLCFPRAPRLH